MTDEQYAQAVSFWTRKDAAAAFRKIPLEALKKLAEPMWLLKIVPTEITCLNSDFKKKGFGSRQIWRAEAADTLQKN